MKAILFSAGVTQVAVSLDSVREVLRRPATAADFETERAIEPIRGRFVKVCDASLLLVGKRSTNPLSKTLLVEMGSQFLGLSTSSVSRIFEYEESRVQPVTAAYSGLTPRYCSAMISIPGRKDPVFILDIPNLFAGEAGNTAEAPVPSDVTQPTDKQSGREGKLVCFKVRNCEYGLSITETVEIIRGRPSHFVPQCRELVEGVINLRGAVLPVIDLRKLAQNTEIPDSSSTKIVIVKFEDHFAGLRVDSMTEVLQYEETSLEPVPSSFEALGRHWISSVLRVEDGRVVFTIDTSWFSKNVA